MTEGFQNQVAAIKKSGLWKKKEYSNANGLFGRTIGIIGLGGIGLEVMKRAKSFGMKVLVWSRNFTPEKADQLGVICCEDLQCLAETSDVVTLHLASTAETEHLIGDSFLQSMKDGAIFVNTSRGKIVDEQALAKAVQTKQLKVGLDVYEDEPASSEDKFSPDIASLDHVYGTHHVGASTSQAQEQIASEVVRIVSIYQSDGRVLNCVNRASRSNCVCITLCQTQEFAGCTCARI